MILSRYLIKAKSVRFHAKICAVVVLAAIVLLETSYAGGGAEGKSHFISGRSDLAAGRYERAIQELSIAAEEFAVLGDYALLYLAEAYHGAGDHKKALDTIRLLIARYPHSPVVKKARCSEITETDEISPENVTPLYEAYIKDYPDDDMMNFKYALLLKKTGDAARAAAIFKALYVKACFLSPQAYSELNGSALKTRELIERASNLMKKYEFQEAEGELRHLLSVDDGKHRDEVLRNLALSLFRQKEYREAAAIYDKINDTFFKARSLYRAGEKQAFETALSSLIAKNDKRAGTLLIAVAADKRRERDFEGALKIYKDVLSSYPEEAEEARWGTGFTYFLSAQYALAADVFSSLYEKYEDPKYLYWRARSVEALGGEAGDLFEAVSKADNNFYGSLSQVRTGKSGHRSVSTALAFDIPAAKQARLDRVDVLKSVGMFQEAVTELTFLAKRVETQSEMLYIISKLQEFGEYRRSIGMAGGVPYSENIRKFLYPLAFMEEVDEIAKKYEMDPLIALSVMREESRFDVNAKSIAGARGLMQIMPQTAYRLDRNIRLGLKSDAQISDPRNNIMLGVYYLKSLFGEFKTLPHVLAAYNAGEMAVRKWSYRGSHRSYDEFIEDIPYQETRNYVKKVLTSYFQYKKITGRETSPAAFDMLTGRL